jgi:hypothetical protein
MKPIKLPPQITNMLGKLRLVAKHHYFIFTILLLGGLTAAVYLVNITLGAPTDQTYYSQKLSESLNSKFDEATIKKIENLQKSDEHSAIPPDLPAGARTNPFAE